MPAEGISPDVREFIFEHIDAVEHLEVLMLLREQRDQEWNSESVSRQLRTHQESAARRLESLEASGLLTSRSGAPKVYQYQAKSPELDKVVEQLAEAWRVRKHRVLELIFSPVKRARSISRAFQFKQRGESNDD